MQPNERCSNTIGKMRTGRSCQEVLDHKGTLRPSLCSDWPERFLAEWCSRSLNYSGATHAREGFASPSRDCIAGDPGVVSAVVVSLSFPGRPLCFLVGVTFPARWPS